MKNLVPVDESVYEWQTSGSAERQAPVEVGQTEGVQAGVSRLGDVMDKYNLSRPVLSDPTLDRDPSCGVVALERPMHLG